MIKLGVISGVGDREEGGRKGWGDQNRFYV